MDDNTFSMDNINAMLAQIMQNPDSINNLLNSFASNASQNNAPSTGQNTNPGQNQGFDLSSLLNNINPEMLNSVLSSMGQQPQNQAPQPGTAGGFDPSMLFGMLGAMGGQSNNSFGGMGGQNQQGDNASRFLMSLKPFVNPQRQSGIDSLCQLLKYAQIAKLFGFDITKLIKL